MTAIREVPARARLSSHMARASRAAMHSPAQALSREIGPPAAAAAADISIVIVNFRSAGDVIACLGSLYRQDHGRTIEVIVVDNASGDGGAERIKAAYPQARVLEMAENLGFAGGNNAGLALARGQFLLLLNPDTEMPDGVLGAVCHRLAADRRIGVIGVPQDVGGRIVGSALRFLTPGRIFIRSLVPPQIIARVMPQYSIRYSAQDVRAEFECEAVVGCFMAMRRDVLDAVGGLDQRIFMYAEELEFCHRVRRAGFAVLHMGGLSVVHHGGVTTRSIPIWRDVQMQQGQLVFIGLTQGKGAARLAGAAMSLSHLVRLPIELVMAGPLWKDRLECRFKRLSRSFKAMFAPPERTVQSID